MTITNGVLTAYSGSATEVVVPAEVVEIDFNAFANCGITSVDLSSSQVVTIGAQAFYNCDNLTKVTFPATLESIESNAFYQTGLTNVDLSGTKLASIGAGAFNWCSDLTEIRLPDTVTSVGKDVATDESLFFCSRSSQTAKALGADNRFCDPSIPDWLWAYDENEMLMVAGYVGNEKVITLPKEATAVAPHAVWKSAEPSWQEAITSVIIPEGYTAIGNNAFENGCECLAYVSLPSTLRSIGEMAFSEYACITMLQLPEGLESIGENALSMLAMKSLTIPTTVTSIPVPIVGYAEVNTVVLPEELTEIVDRAFGDCLTDVYCYEGSYAEQWANAQNTSGTLAVHYINETSFDEVTVSGPDTSAAKIYVHDAGTARSWMEGISVSKRQPGVQYTFTCTSSDPDVARVNGDMVEYLKPGKATLTVSLEGRTGVTPYVITEEIYKPVESFTVPSVVFAKLRRGEEFNYVYVPIQVEPADANPWFGDQAGFSNPQKVTEGKLKTRWFPMGNLFVRPMYSMSGVSQNVRVLIYETFNSIAAYAPTRDLVVGEFYDPDITLTVDGQSIGDLDIYTITSSNKNVAVGVKGKYVKAVGQGTATITVKEPISKLTTSFTVTVDTRDALLTPRFLTVIGKEAFAGIGAKEVILYEECTAIQSRAFANCANLKRIEIPASVETIAEDAFTGCPGDLTIVAPSYSAAKDFADQHGYLWENLAQ